MENTIQDKIIDRSKLIYESNYTSIPNIIFDYWMPKLTPGEFNILMCICRKTFGANKKESKISIKEIQKVTGLSKSGIIKMVAHLVDLRLVKKIVLCTGFGKINSCFYCLDTLEGGQ